MSVEICRRIWWEQRVRSSLLVLFAALWGFLLVTLFGVVDDATRTNFGPEQIRAALRILNVDPLAVWVGFGQEHPLFLGAASVFVVGGGVRAVAGELEAGTLELVLSRPVSRSRHLASYVAVLVTGAVAIAVAYAAGCWLAWVLTSPEPGSLAAGPLARMAVLTLLLLLAIAGYSLLCSSLASERGRALAWAVGLTIVMYAWNVLASLSSALQPFARLSLWWWYSPSRVVDGGAFPWGDAGVLALVALATAAAAWAVFLRRDLA